MKEKILYPWVLVFKKTKEYIGYSQSEKKPAAGDNSTVWIEWNKEIPTDALEKKYKLYNKKLVLLDD